MAPGVVHIDDIAARDSRVEEDLVVGRPVGIDLELPDDDHACEKQYTGRSQDCSATEQQDRRRQDKKPEDRRESKIGNEKEAGDSGQAADDVKGVGGQWLDLGEQLAK